MRILLVEDEVNISKVIKLNLELDGFEVVKTMYGLEALELMQAQHFDLMVLDIMLPDISGIEVCKQTRLENDKIPIIIVSAKDSSEDRIKGLRVGADDYLVKPFHLKELRLRIEKLLQRSGMIENNTIPEVFRFGDNVVNFITFQAKNSKSSFKLTKKESKLMKLFIQHAGEVISRKQILQVVWGYDVFPSTRTVDNFILSFRKRFEKDPKVPIHFHSIRGVGYKFTP